ncbi:unnamed protein product [Agarophyton chilense]
MITFVLPFFGPSRNLTPKSHPFQESSACTLRGPRTSVLLCSADTTAVSNLRQQIDTIAGSDRGIFGLEQHQRDTLDSFIKDLECNNPNPNPTSHDAKAAAGSWRLLYTTLEILGRKRVRLAISSPRKPGLVKLGNFFQFIDPSNRQSKNVVEFKLLTGASGTFTITAEYHVVSRVRVNVSTTATALEPPSFEALLGSNMPLLTQIFNPDGYLDITYLDESLRVGRDSKGHIFVLERAQV